MEIIENKFRETPSSHKKYVKRLSEYIVSLLKRGRIIESKFYFLELELLKPSHEKTCILGYELAIKTFDNEAVLRFDISLVNMGFNEEKLFCLRLMYYYSVRNKSSFNHLAVDLLKSNKLKNDSLKLIIPMVLHQKSYESIVALCAYLERDKKELIASFEKETRKVVLQKLVDVIHKVNQ